MNENRKTAGQVQLELVGQSLNDTHSAHDQTLEQLSEYEKNLVQRVEAAKREYDKDFYIVVITKREKLLDRILRHYFLARHTCPTPQYDEAVYKYTRKDDRIEFLWVVPSKPTCEEFAFNPFGVPEDEKELYNFVLKFKNGDLDKLAMKLNGEIIYGEII